MANYYCTVRSNYFHVKDEGKFMQLMDKVRGEDHVEVWRDRTDDNGVVFGFGCYGSIYGVEIPDDSAEADDWDTDYNAFIDGLKECVADDDCIIIFEAGYEKLRFVVGTAEIITSDDYEVVDLMESAVLKASSMIASKNPNWATKCAY